MNCPQCGLEVAAGQRFCRSCGASLQMTTKPLSGALVSDTSQTPGVVVRREKQRPNGIAGIAFWGFIAMFVGVVIGVTGKKLLHQDVVTFVGILISLVGMFLTAYPYIAPRRRVAGSTSETDSLTSSPSKAPLPQPTGAGFIGSVTERTTDLLGKTSPVTPSPKQNEKSSS